MDVAIKAGVCTSRNDKLEDFIAVEYMNSLKLIKLTWRKCVGGKTKLKKRLNR